MRCRVKNLLKDQHVKTNCEEIYACSWICEVVKLVYHWLRWRSDAPGGLTMDKLRDEWMERWMNEKMDGWVIGWRDGWKNGWMEIGG